jgi:methylmalonyl-CoA/ethylmalonyl-CoA epimerase
VVFHHVGIFVSDIAHAQRELGRTLPIREWAEVIADNILRVKVCFGVDHSGLRYELVAPHGEPNPVSKVLESRRNILNHTAYAVTDLQTASQTLRAAGSVPIGPPKPAAAFGGAPVMFFLTSLGFIVELIELPVVQSTSDSVECGTK